MIEQTAKALPFKGVRADACEPLARIRPNAEALCAQAGRVGWGWVYRSHQRNGVHRGRTDKSENSGRQLQRKLRNTPTDAERLLWQRLRGRQADNAKFRRQHPFDNYIVDFACLERKIVIEPDGGQHAEAAGYDAERTRQLEKAGFVVLRFWNNDVFENMSGVLEVIWMTLRMRVAPSPPNPSGLRAQRFGVRPDASQWLASIRPHPLEGEG